MLNPELPLLVLLLLAAVPLGSLAQCNCVACMDEAVVSAGATRQLFSGSCDNGEIAAISELRIHSTDESTFTVRTKDHAESSMYYTGASSDDHVYCYNSASSNVGGSSQISVTVTCTNFWYACPLEYDIRGVCIPVEEEEAQWATSSWGTCQEDCQQSREVFCELDGQKTDDYKCGGTKPVATRSCSGGDCVYGNDDKFECFTEHLSVTCAGNPDLLDFDDSLSASVQSVTIHIGRCPISIGATVAYTFQGDSDTASLSHELETDEGTIEITIYEVPLLGGLYLVFHGTHLGHGATTFTVDSVNLEVHALDVSLLSVPILLDYSIGDSSITDPCDLPEADQCPEDECAAAASLHAFWL
ncbi:hypothetical protein QOT17_005693 [Balamuthia mandrillaris]